VTVLRHAKWKERNRTFLWIGSLVFVAVMGSAPYTRAQTPTTSKAAASASAAPSSWVPKSVAYLKPSNTAKYNQFGYFLAVSADGNTLAVGAPAESSNAKGINGNQADQSALESGAVYLYVRKGGMWVQQAYVKASNARAGAQFGSAVALSGDGNTLAVSSYLESGGAKGVNGNQTDYSKDSSGAVYVFTRTAATWSQQAYLKASNAGDGDQFGFSVSLSANGNTLAVGAIEEGSKATGVNGDQTDRSEPGTGAAYVFTRGGATWSQQAYLKPDKEGLFGYGIALSADGNTVAVGASNEGPGAVYAFARKGTNWSQQGHMMGVNAEEGDALGWSVAISGDGNTIVSGANDEDSLLTGVPPNDQGGNDRARDTSSGAAYVFVRSGTDWKQQVWLKATNTRKNDKFGTSIAISGDGNTVAVGAQFAAGTGASNGVNGDPSNDDMASSGSVYIYTRKGETWAPAAYVKAPNARGDAQFGVSVALSSDGRTLAASAPKDSSGAKGVNGNQADTSAIESGAAYVFY
jgi:hypothetical protein